jgi:dnd system-associated protein 4
VTISEAAVEVLQSSKRPLSLNEIIAEISNRSLYHFNSEDKISIVREQVRRHCYLPNKRLQFKPILFVQIDEDIYDLMEQNSIAKNVNYRRIRRARDKEILIDRLTKKGDAKFGEIWRLLIFGACLGLARNERHPIGDYDTGKSIDFSYFGGCSAWPGFLYLLNLVEVEEDSVLNYEQDTIDRQINCFEEYANGGLSIIQVELESKDYSLDSLIGLIPNSIAESIQQVDVSTQI